MSRGHKARGAVFIIMEWIDGGNLQDYLDAKGRMPWPEATQAIERAMDLFAGEIGIDPAEVRRRNLFASDAFPLTTASGARYDSGDYERALDLALETADYDALREEQRRRREQGDPVALGIGVSVYVDATPSTLCAAAETAAALPSLDSR